MIDSPAHTILSAGHLFVRKNKGKTPISGDNRRMFLTSAQANDRIYFICADAPIISEFTESQGRFQYNFNKNVV